MNPWRDDGPQPRAIPADDDPMGGTYALGLALILTAMVIAASAIVVVVVMGWRS